MSADSLQILITAITAPLLDRIESLEQKLTIRMDHSAREMVKQKTQLNTLKAASEAQNTDISRQLRTLDTRMSSFERSITGQLRSISRPSSDHDDLLRSAVATLQAPSNGLPDVSERLERKIKEDQTRWTWLEGRLARLDAKFSTAVIYAQKR